MIATALNTRENKSSPYMLRGGNKFLAGDIPFYFMNARDRYMAVADVLFDVLDEQPQHPQHLAIVRVEDVHSYFELPLLATSLATLRKEQVPANISLIPLFVDPFNAYGQGQKVTPVPVNQDAALNSVLQEVARHPRNAIIWHGVTHQHGDYKNPYSAVSGEDFEFWDVPKDNPFPQDDPAFWLDYLRPGLPVIQSYHAGARYWLTPHYAASASANRVAGKLFPWSLGRARYFASSFKAEFTLRAVEPDARAKQPALDQGTLDQLGGQTWEGVDRKSEIGIEQLFPYEIYRDAYGQGIVPDTLGYIEIPAKPTGDALAQTHSVGLMLADARRNLVVRDYWAGFFFHPFIFAGEQRGAVGRYYGDTSELQKLIKGLKQLGYVFPSLAEFEGVGTAPATRFSGAAAPGGASP